jgi:hypothetical protein
MKELLEQPPELTIASKYTALNGIAYLVIGTMLIVWPGATLLSLSYNIEERPNEDFRHPWSVETIPGGLKVCDAMSGSEPIRSHRGISAAQKTGLRCWRADVAVPSLGAEIQPQDTGRRMMLRHHAKRLCFQWEIFRKRKL